jgi:uncharacterized phage protein (predicted DNA packaging)
MGWITTDDLKAHLNVTTDADDALLADKLAAAEQWVAGYTGTDIDADPADVDEPIKEAVRQLAAHLYENREASLVGVSAEQLPFGFLDLLAPYRAWAF